MKLWIARDKDGDISLYYEKKPRLDKFGEFWGHAPFGMRLSNNSFSEVTFEKKNSPQEVELKLVEKKMAFLYSAFVRKNTSELRKKLEKLGYSCAPNGHGAWFIPINELSCLETFHRSSCYMGRSGLWDTSIIDCGDNEELFLAIAALRDNTDKCQWFTDGNIWEVSNEDLPSRYMQLNGHKATVDELIEYF